MYFFLPCFNQDIERSADDNMNDTTVDSKSIQNDILKRLEEQHVIMPNAFREVFEHHLDVLAYRILHDECVTYEDNTMANQVLSENVKLAQDILKPVFAKYQVVENHMEELLLAIYIQMAKGEMNV